MSNRHEPFGNPFIFDRHLDEMTEEELREALSIIPYQTAVRRCENIRRHAAQTEMEIGDGKWCLRVNPCRKDSCLHCRYVEQRRYLLNYSTLLQKTTWRKLVPALREAESPLSITIVPWFGKLPIGGGEGDLREFIEKVKTLLKYYAPNAIGFFCVDISWNVCRETGDEHWQLHVHGVVWNLDEESKERLKAALKRDDGEVGRPLLVKPMHYPDGWVAYMAKPNFFLRESYQEDGSWKTNERPLSLEQEVEMARWLSPYKTNSRHFTMGLYYSPSAASEYNTLV